MKGSSQQILTRWGRGLLRLLRAGFFFQDVFEFVEGLEGFRGCRLGGSEYCVPLKLTWSPIYLLTRPALCCEYGLGFRV